MTEANEVVITDEDINGEEISEEELADDGKDVEYWKAEAKKQSGIAKRRATKLEKLKAIPKEEIKIEKKDELDLMQLAYLESKGFESDEEIDFVKKFMKQSGLNVRDAIKEEYLQSKLKSMKDAKAVLDATPKGTKSSNTSPVKDTVEYWLAKGELPKDNRVLAEKVLRARIEKEKNSSMFYNS